jgi:hypothetical protein
MKFVARSWSDRFANTRLYRRTTLSHHCFYKEKNPYIFTALVF